MTEALPPAVFLMGPTGSGKTDLAIELVNRMPFEIISVDSAQVYRGMDIGTAKPDRATLELAPHRLIDICDAAENYSAARFREDALRHMHEITAAGRVPLLVGGTGLYFRALEQGLSRLPSASAELRQSLDADMRKLGSARMHQRLAAIDPQSAARIHPNDPQRIQRALEIHAASGRTMTELLEETRGESVPFSICKLALAPEQRSGLHERLAIRFRNMIDAGLIDEVEQLYQRDDLNISSASMRIVGYRQVWEYLDGVTDLARMTEKAIIATRQLAKRQYTWLRSESHLNWFDSESLAVREKILQFLQKIHA